MKMTSRLFYLTTCLFTCSDVVHQEALQTARAESTKWQSLCEELRGSSTQLKRGLDVSTEQLQQLHTQLEVRGDVTADQDTG